MIYPVKKIKIKTEDKSNPIINNQKKKNNHNVVRNVSHNFAEF